MNNDSIASITTAEPETDLEALADGLQSQFVLRKAAGILALMRTTGTTPQAVGLFEQYWPHINKAWGRALRFRERWDSTDDHRFRPDCCTDAGCYGGAEYLRERVEAALDTAEQVGDDRLKAIARYFMAVSAMQTRNYAAALPLLESVRDSFPDGHEDPSPIDVLTALGGSYVGLGRDEEAGRAFEEASKEGVATDHFLPAHYWKSGAAAGGIAQPYVFGDGAGGFACPAAEDGSGVGSAGQCLILPVSSEA